MSRYRFLSTDITTGKVLSDAIPLTGGQCSRLINSVGSLSAALTLAAGTTGQVAEWVKALEPWKSILWVLQDGHPIWNGPITGWPQQSIIGGQLQIQAASMEEVFKHRQVTDSLSWSSTDVFEIFRGFLIYALSKTPYGNIAGTGRYANTSGVVDTVEYSGVVGSVTEQDSLKKIYDCWGDLVSTYGLEYALTPALAGAGSLFTRAELGLPLLGRKYADTRLQFVFPSANVIDYGWMRLPGSSGPANRFVATGSGGGTNPKSYTSTQSDFYDHSNLGYPLLEESGAFTGTVTSQSQLDGYATGELDSMRISDLVTPVVYLGAGRYPQVRDFQLGDEAYFAATSPLHPAGPGGVPGVSGKFRIYGWMLTFPSDTQTEQTQVQLGGAGVDALANASLGV